MNFDLVKRLIETNHLPTFHLKTLTAQLTNGLTDYNQLTSWPKQLRDHAASLPFHSYVSTGLTRGLKDSAKALLTYKDAVSIETVLIQTKPNHYSVCVSCQSGCAMACTFCATGSLGLTRSLTAEEITDQYLFWKQSFPDKPIKSIVFMGMGEPFANQTEVFKAINWFQTYYGLGYRHITVSTCGLPAGIHSLAATYPQVNLAISLHAATQPLRQSLMPIAKTISLEQLAEAINGYFHLCHRQLTFEYLLLRDVNDTKTHLDDLISWLSQFPPELVHVNLIGYNTTSDKFTKPSHNRIHFALDYLTNHRVSATIRKSLGEDILGACGQLALKHTPT